MHIPFNRPIYTEKSREAVIEAMQNHKISGDGSFTKRCSRWFEERTGTAKALLTTSCTHATEMAALLLDIKPGDEVILPSFTFVSTADAFVLRGATAVFVDIRPDTMNLDEKLIEAAITEKTRAIVPVHYAGVSCEMDTILEIAERYGLAVVEDAAQGMLSTYKGRALGTMGDFGCLSFHETKNFSMGEGGCLFINEQQKGQIAPKVNVSGEHSGMKAEESIKEGTTEDNSIRLQQTIERAEIIREKGTNRSRFFRGEIDKYTWVDAGSSYLPSELNAAYLWGQLEEASLIIEDRLRAWNRYYEALLPLQEEGKLELPVIPAECEHNGHIFYIKVKDLKERTALLSYLKEKGVNAVFHYIPLHSAPAGKKYGRFSGEDRYTTRESERLVRLPLYYGITEEEMDFVVEKIKEFYGPVRV